MHFSDYYDHVERRTVLLPNVSFGGFVSPGEIDEQFRRVALLVTTTDYEGFGNVLLKAWRYKTPIISLHYTLYGVIDTEPVGVHVGLTSAVPDAVDLILDDIDHRHGTGWPAASTSPYPSAKDNAASHTTTFALFGGV